MPKTSFHACKHYNKYIEYAAAGISGVFSKTEPYVRLLEMNAPGAKLCENTTEAWIEAISSWLDAPEELERARASLYPYAQNALSVAVTSKAVEELISQSRADVHERTGTPVHSGWLTGVKALNIVRRGVLLVKAHGIHTPKIVIRRIIHHA